MKHYEFKYIFQFQMDEDAEYLYSDWNDEQPCFPRLEIQPITIRV